MVTAGQRPVINAADRNQGAALVMTWAEGLPPGTHLSTMCQLELVGMITAALADARAAGRHDGLTSAADRLRLWASTLESVL